MKTGFHAWLRQQVERLENEIRSSDVFDTDAVPTNEQLMELRRLAVVHRYLVTQMEKVSQQHQELPVRRRDTREIDVRQYVSV